MESLMIKMKNDYDSLMVIPFEEYLKLMPYLTFKKYPKNTVLKGILELETKSRYIFDGLIGLFEEKENESICRRIFGVSDTVCDFDSYLHNKKTNQMLIAYTDCLVAEFSKESELKVVEQLKFFAELGLKINHRINSRDEQWKKLYWMNPKERHDHLHKICPHLEAIKIKQICGILNLPERTVSRLRESR